MNTGIAAEKALHGKVISLFNEENYLYDLPTMEKGHAPFVDCFLYASGQDRLITQRAFPDGTYAVPGSYLLAAKATGNGQTASL